MEGEDLQKTGLVLTPERLECLQQKREGKKDAFPAGPGTIFYTFGMPLKSQANNL